MPKLPSSPAERRATFLGFQPPAIGEEEVEAVAETLRSGWLTTGPRGHVRRLLATAGPHRTSASVAPAFEPLSHVRAPRPFSSGSLRARAARRREHAGSA